MERFSGNPILTAIEGHAWESREVFNAAAVYLDGKIHILYRAIGNDHVSRIGYATSTDGFHIEERLPDPVFEPATEPEKDGCEDPRIVHIDDQLILTYTALREYSHLQVYQAALTSISKDDFLNRTWKWGSRRLPFPGIRNKNSVVFPQKIGSRYAMLHRIEPDMCIAYSDDLTRWCDIMAVMGPRANSWDNWKIGIAGPPMKITEGWLIIYHGVSVDRMYFLGFALLDAEHPEHVLFRSKEYLLSPKEDYERFGKVPNVVFSTGNIIIDDKLFVYYGGADSVLCVATIGLDKLLSQIRR
ncbi:MAG: glycosidase [Candidatus Bathyarchaeota archaeon]|nr:glycosidase [Candidatus Bathyarchaeota archaeon]